MFNWFIKKTVKAVAEIQNEEAQKEKLQDAYELGQKAVQQFMSEVDAYTVPHLSMLQRNLMKVYRERLDSVENDTEVPPIIAARIEQRILLDNVDNHKQEWFDEIWSKQASWHDVLERMGVIEDVRGCVWKKVDDFALQMFDASLSELLSRADHLKPLDHAWRAANPEKSAQYPQDK